jgi:hypothetical protein
MRFWEDLQNGYAEAYDRFAVNRQYRNKSFKSDAEYVKAQTKLAEQIDELDKKALAKCREVIGVLYPDIEVLMLDSRMNSVSKQSLGRLLCKGIESTTACVDVEQWFLRQTAHRIGVDRIEDLPEDLQKKLQEKR